MTQHLVHSRRWLVGACLFLLPGLVACGPAQVETPPAGVQADTFLFERANQALEDRQWQNARTYFQQIVDNYPQSEHRQEAKLGMGRTFIGEGGAEAMVMAANEFREFLAFYPTSPRADFAQYQLAMTHFEQMRAPERDQTETKLALQEFDVFFERYPNSPLMPEVKQNWRIARDRLSEAIYRIGLHYYRVDWYPGAIDRFRQVLSEDPGYGGRDAVYYHLAEALAESDKTPEAIPYYERILAEFDQSEYLDDARERLQELKSQQVMVGGP